MSTPGDITLVDKLYDEIVPATGPIAGGTLLKIRDDSQGVNTDRLILPTQRTFFGLEIQCVFANGSVSTPVINRPERIQVQLVRFKSDGSVDPTGKSQRNIVQPGTTTWADTFLISEFVNDTDGAFGFIIAATRREDGNPVHPFRIDVQVWDITNHKANTIHINGGWNVMSDGSVSNKPWKIT